MRALASRKVGVGWAVALAAAASASGAWAQAPANSRSSGDESALNGLGDHLNRTGRFATVPVTTAGAIAPSERTRGGHGDVRVRRASGNAAKDPAALPAGSNEVQYNKAFGAVEDCRLDVARRRGVVPQTVPAGTLTLRWTIEGSGAVRDAEAVAVSGTDPEVAACAKRVFTGWQFLPPAEGQVVVERTFTFRTLP